MPHVLPRLFGEYNYFVCCWLDSIHSLHELLQAVSQMTRAYAFDGDASAPRYLLRSGTEKLLRG